MPKVRYKIWLEIEAITTYDDGDEDYENDGLPLPLVEFDTMEEAEAARDIIAATYTRKETECNQQT